MLKKIENLLIAVCAMGMEIDDQLLTGIRKEIGRGLVS